MINVLLMRPLRFISLSLSLLQQRQAASEAPAMPSQACGELPFSPTILGGERDSQKKEHLLLSPTRCERLSEN